MRGQREISRPGSQCRRRHERSGRTICLALQIVHWVGRPVWLDHLPASQIALVFGAEPILVGPLAGGTDLGIRQSKSALYH